MTDPELARRSFLRLMGGTLGASCVALNWREIAVAAEQAAAAGSLTNPSAPKFLAPGEAADVEAICAQIIPTDARIQAGWWAST